MFNKYKFIAILAILFIIIILLISYFNVNEITPTQLTDYNLVTASSIWDNKPLLKLIPKEQKDKEIIKFIENLLLYKEYKDEINETILINIVGKGSDLMWVVDEDCAGTLTREELLKSYRELARRTDAIPPYLPTDVTYIIAINPTCWNVNFGKDYSFNDNYYFREAILQHEIFHVVLLSKKFIQEDESNLFSYSEVIVETTSERIDTIGRTLQEIYAYNMGINYMIKQYGAKKVAGNEDLYKVFKFLYENKIKYGRGLILSQDSPLKFKREGNFDPNKYNIIAIALEARRNYDEVEALRK